MDRRQYLGLAGTSITALLGGCSGDGNSGGETVGAANTPYTSTPANQTSPPTATDTATSTETATATPVPDPFNVNRSYLEFILKEYLPSGERGQKVENNYNENAVDEDSTGWGEDILTQLGGIPGLTTGTEWRFAYPSAQVGQYITHEIHGEPIDPSRSDSVHVMPVPMIIDGEYQNAIDLLIDEGRTTLLPVRDDTSADNILYHDESAESKIEGEIQSTTQAEFPNDAATRLEHYETYKQFLERDSFSPGEVDMFNIQLGKLVPDLYPQRLMASEPQVQITESGHGLLEKKAITEYGGVDPYVDLNEGFRDVAVDEIGVITAENGSLEVVGIPEEEYDNSSLHHDDI